jgi:hypothetical protein
MLAEVDKGILLLVLPQETDLETASRALEGKHLRSNKLVDLAPYLTDTDTAAASAG